MNSEANISERQELIEAIRRYDSFYIAYSFELYSLDDLYLLKHHLEKNVPLRGSRV